MIPDEKRLTPERVRRAYESIGLSPCYGGWVMWDEDDEQCSGDIVGCCGSTAVYLDLAISEGQSLREATRNLLTFTPSNQIALKCDVSETYLLGFATGFDLRERKITGDPSPEFTIGFEDGQAANRHLIKS
jgi:hypothetical protein